MRLFALPGPFSRQQCACLLSLLCALPVAAEPPARVIVKLRGDANLALKQTLAADYARSGAPAGGKLIAGRELAPGMQVWQARGLTSEQLAARLRQQAGVEFAEPDRIKKIRAVPNDALYGSQWYLQNTQIASINAEAAWDVSTGNPALTIAVIDTGIRPNHPDLLSRLLPGYDFVSDLAMAADGNAADADASDPGDGLTSADLATPDLAGCGGGDGSQPVDSSWHGTRVAGIIGAQGNNGAGVSGVGWNLRLLPVRALGKCGGHDSDIIAAMRWAAGLSVSGAPLNPHPAKILNLSLGGQGSCSFAFRSVVSELTAAGVLVVAAAGNSTGPVEEPGNCPGVLAVAGVRHEGNKVGYSSYGIEVGISAPAGNCVNETGPCLFPMYTTTNDGQYAPRNDVYTGQSEEITVGTSFAAPLAAGVAGLMWSVQPALTPAQLIRRMQGSARAFVNDSSLPRCPAVVPGGTQEGQCSCTTSTCGAGLLQAGAAVNEALRPIAGFSYAGIASAGQTLTLDARSSVAATGAQLARYQWSAVFSDGAPATVENADRPQAQISLQRSGTLTLSLVVTDDAGRVDASSQLLSISAAAGGGSGNGSSGNGSSSGSSSGGSTDTGSGSGGTVTTPATPVADSGGGGGGGGGAFDYTGLLLLAGVSLLAWRCR